MLLAIFVGQEVPPSSAASPPPAKTDQQTADSTQETSAEVERQSEPASWMLRYQFRENDLVYFRRRSRSTMRVSARDVTQLLRESRETYKHYRVVTVDNAGSAVLEPVIDRTIMHARSDEDEPIVWDSRSKQAVPRRFQVVAEKIGRPVVRVRYRSNGKVEEALPVDGAEQKLNPDLASYGFLVRLPDRPVSVGDSWNDDFHVQVSAEPELSRKLQKEIPIRRIYTLKKVQGSIAEIVFRTFVQKPVRDPIIKAQLVSRSLTGTVRFDTSRGLILEWTSVGAGQVFNPYGSSSSLESSFSSVERYLTKDQARQKPALSVTVPGAAPKTNVPGVALPPGRKRL